MPSSSVNKHPVLFAAEILLVNYQVAVTGSSNYGECAEIVKLGIGSFDDKSSPAFASSIDRSGNP